MPLQSVEPMMLLSAVTVPGEVVVAVATGATAAFTAMGKAIQVLYKNGRQDSIDSISALKDSAHALGEQNAALKDSAHALTEQNAVLKEQAAALNKQADLLSAVSTYIQREEKRASSG